jgi:hypothetical protein
MEEFGGSRAPSRDDDDANHRATERSIHLMTE